MTTENAAGNGHVAPLQPSAARYLRCGRCGVPQPVVSTAQFRCVSCGAPLQRWIAHPPLVSGPAATRPPRPRPRPASSRLPYLGPPSYRGGHPRWSFPPVVWKELPDPPTTPVGNPGPGLRRAAWLAIVTAVAAACAAGAEIWRFALMLQGRTLVLSGTAVRTSDVLVAATGLAVVVAALATVVVAVPAVVRTHAAAARRLGRAPSRSNAAVLARLLVPVWNIYGAGQIAVEIDRMLAQGGPEDEQSSRGPGTTSSRGEASRQEASRQEASRQRTSRLTTLWWCGWIASALLVLATLARGWGGSLQAIADTVQLHIAVDLVAAAVAVLTALLLRRFAAAFGARRHRLAGWQVQPPAPTRPLPEPAETSAGTSAATSAGTSAGTSAEPAGP